ncbi:hypothetical protein GOP47_0013284 [Adiantum capillus-veneris]|uniref:Conserved oligomeric Golgi complex subunit 3 n=1 Tax=Adiantum capillus-veneris TaxID=13818 RepID=A0A9D4ZD13_ADICA|nr:hypothetical protein GOP47_0013284 [Adiantum capillus-veneris]
MASRGPATRPAAVSRGYTFASSWDQNAPLTEQQKTACAALVQAFAERPMPSHVDEHVTGHFSDSIEESSDHSSFPTEAVLLNSHQFYQWFTDLESAMKSETEEKYQRYVNTLTEHVETCDQILEQLDSTLLLFDDLQEQHQAVATKTKTLHDACERLVLEKDRLVEFADALRNKLNYFDELENIATQFYSPTMSVASGHFLPLLKRLDECISYVSNNPQYADSGVYAVKFRQLQSRALSMVRTHVLGVLKTAAQQVQVGIKESATVHGKAGLSEAAETSVLYVRFKAAANEIKPLMEEIENRKSKAEYSQILADCHSLYCEQRLTLVRGVVRQRISGYAKSEPLASLTRQGCAYLMQVCQSEHQLFDHFFSSSSSDTSNLAPLVDPLCTVLYDILRPKLIHEADLELLCELVEILKGEVLEEELGRRGDSVAGLKPTITRILADVQERLTFRAQTHMRDEIANYLPSAEDLDYPAKLEREASIIANLEDEEGRDTYGTLYPPLEKTLSCLSKLYRSLEPAIFTGLAQDSIGVCSLSIQKASKLIMKQSQMDGQLFLIKHLLILREQIAPFDIDFAITYKELDFAHLLDHLRRIFRGQASFFDFASRSTLARAFSPRVTENQLDAKKDLERTLKSTCEQFIMSITKLAVEPMLSFITKVTAVKVSVTAIHRSGEISGDACKSLKDQAFATPEKVAEMVAKVDEAIKKDLPNVVSKMKLYLQNPSTRSILFKPIKSNIIEAYEQINALINDEYAVEDIAVIGLPQIAGVQAYLDGLC